MKRQLNGSSIAVTGAAGFMGTNLIRHFNREYNIRRIVGIDNMFNSSQANLKTLAAEDNLTLYKEDIERHSSLEYIFKRHSIDYVFNLATKPLNYSFDNPSNTCLTNPVGTINLLELLRCGQFGALCHISSSEVYGSPKGCWLNEESRFNPLTPYAAGKAAADLAIKSYVNTFDLEAIIIRPFNNYGPHQNAIGSLAAVIPRTIMRIKEGKTPQVSGTGLQSREFVFVADTVHLISSLFQMVGNGAEVNISSETQMTIIDVITRICVAMNYDPEQILYTERRASDVDSHRASNSLLKDLCPYTFTSFDDGIRKTIDWYEATYG